MTNAARIAQLEAELAETCPAQPPGASPEPGNATPRVGGSDHAAVAALARWRDSPIAMVEELFGVVPDAWQRAVLADLPRHQRIALQGSKGVGKSCVLAWTIWWVLLTRAHAKIAVVSISGDALADTLWVELATWHSQAKVLQAAFEMTKTRIQARSAPDTWFASARTWPRTANAQEQASTLSGLHAERIMFILDEAGSMPPVILASAEAALSACIEGKILLAGNPTDLDGALHQAAADDAKHWSVHRISGDPDDPKRAPRVSIAWARKQIELYGPNNPWVLVNVFGRFPPSSLNSLLGPDDIRNAMQRLPTPEEYERYEKRIGVDVATTGEDASVIFFRQGPLAHRPITMRNASGPQIAGQSGHIVKQWGGRVTVFVDASGGYGWSVVEHCRAMGLSVAPVGFAERAQDSERYLNRRAEMAFRCASAIKRSLRLPPNCPELLLFARIQQRFSGDRLALEDKDEIRKRLGQSPDHIDALMLTYAVIDTIEQEFQYDFSMGDPSLRATNAYEHAWQWGQRQKAAASTARELQDYHPLASAWNQKPGEGYPSRGAWKGIGRRGGF
jgi:phage terminase large subunit